LGGSEQKPLSPNRDKKGEPNGSGGARTLKEKRGGGAGAINLSIVFEKGGAPKRRKLQRRRHGQEVDHTRGSSSVQDVEGKECKPGLKDCLSTALDEEKRKSGGGGIEGRERD